MLKLATSTKYKRDMFSTHVIKNMNFGFSILKNSPHENLVSIDGYGIGINIHSCHTILKMVIWPYLGNCCKKNSDMREEVVKKFQKFCGVIYGRYLNEVAHGKLGTRTPTWTHVGAWWSETRRRKIRQICQITESKHCTLWFNEI